MLDLSNPLPDTSRLKFDTQIDYLPFEMPNGTTGCIWAKTPNHSGLTNLVPLAAALFPHNKWIQPDPMMKLAIVLLNTIYESGPNALYQADILAIMQRLGYARVKHDLNTNKPSPIVKGFIELNALISTLSLIDMAEEPHKPGEATFLPYPQITIDNLDENNWLDNTDNSDLTVNNNDIMILVPGALCMMTLDYDWFIKLTNIVTGGYSKTTDTGADTDTGTGTATQHTIEALVATMESDGAIATDTRERIIAAANRVLKTMND